MLSAMEALKLIRIAYKLRIVKKHGENPYLIDITHFISRIQDYLYVDNPRYPIKYANKNTSYPPLSMRGLLPKEILRILKQTSKNKKKIMNYDKHQSLRSEKKKNKKEKLELSYADLEALK